MKSDKVKKALCHRVLNFPLEISSTNFSKQCLLLESTDMPNRKSSSLRSPVIKDFLSFKDEVILSSVFFFNDSPWGDSLANSHLYFCARFLPFSLLFLHFRLLFCHLVLMGIWVDWLLSGHLGYPLALCYWSWERQRLRAMVGLPTRFHYWFRLSTRRGRHIH